MALAKLDWKFDVDVCEDLMNDYSVCDFWPTVNAAAERGRETLHMVRATKGGRWTDEDIRGPPTLGELPMRRYSCTM